VVPGEIFTYQAIIKSFPAGWYTIYNGTYALVLHVDNITSTIYNATISYHYVLSNATNPSVATIYGSASIGAFDRYTSNVNWFINEYTFNKSYNVESSNPPFWSWNNATWNHAGVQTSQSSDEVEMGFEWILLNYTLVLTSPPQQLNATAGNGRILLTWSEPAVNVNESIVTSYEIFVGTTSGGEKFLATVTGNVFNYTVSGLTNGQRYYFTICAVNAAGAGPNSSEASAIPVAPHTPAPTNSTTTVIVVVIVGGICVVGIWVSNNIKRKKRRDVNTPKPASAGSGQEATTDE
jgi:hypothetical protein